jgi:hypothetical protein
MINQKATKIVFNNHNNKYNILVIMNIKLKDKFIFYFTFVKFF